MPAPTPDQFKDYFGSDLHRQRMAESIRRTVEKLIAIGNGEAGLFAAFSEGIGMIFGVAQFYRGLGLKHQAAKVMTAAFKWLKGGID